MCYIYCIENKINGKKYVGKTSLAIEKRFRQHINDSKRARCEKRPLYSAMNKYGTENFVIYLLEECDKTNLSEREMFWINKLNTLKNGYNATLGGDGKFLINDDEVVNEYKKLKRASLVANKLHHDEGQVCNILKRNGIILENHPYDSGIINRPKKIEQYSMSGELLKTFDSVTLAMEYLFENGIVKNKKSGIRGHICDNANGKTKSSYGFIWKYKEN